MAELVAGIKAVGLMQPILIKTSGTPWKYKIIAGERRWRACNIVYSADGEVDVKIADCDDVTVSM